jgi:ABC-type sugar transport system ATPase subunit
MNLIALDNQELRRKLGAPASARLAGLRPQDVRLNDADAVLRGTVQLVEPIGFAQIVHVGTADTRIVAVASPQPAVGVGVSIALGADRERLHFFDEAGRRI